MSPNPFKIEDVSSLTELLPAFEFDRLIAQDGMGAVYKARQRSLDRDVAIKILAREPGDDPLFRSSFEAEAKAMARLTHPNLIKVYDFGDQDGLLYIVMEYVPGNSLHQSAHGIAIDSKQAVEIVIALCRGLAHAHQNGIIHRDIRPANILLTRKCEPKIGDFGLARCTRTEADGLAMGTRGYMAPEVIHDPAKGDSQSDVFAIGVVLRELLTGIPAGNENAAKQAVSDLKLDGICRTATHANPALRYPDASSLAEQLTQWLASKTTVAVVAAKHPATRRPAPVIQRKKGVSPTRHTAPSKWAVLKNCASIAFLLCTSYITWEIYQTRDALIARQQLEKNADGAMTSRTAESKAVTRILSAGDLLAIRFGALRDSSSESLARMGTELVAGNSK